jgi:YihY family inner membrane protein
MKFTAIKWLWELFYDSYHMFDANHGGMRTAALTYTSFLTVLPLMILISAMIGQFDYLGLLIAWLKFWDAKFNLNIPLHFITPLLQQVETIRFDRLGLFSVIGLLFTFWLNMSDVEDSLNAMWGIGRKRTLIKRVMVYTPFLLAVAVCLGLIAIILDRFRYFAERILNSSLADVLLDNPWMPDVVRTYLEMGSVVLALGGGIWILLSLFYLLIPNTHVSIPTALFSALLFAGILCGFIALAVRFEAYMFERYSVIYGSLAVMPTLFLGAYICWFIILFGCAFSSRLQLKLFSRKKEMNDQLEQVEMA